MHHTTIRRVLLLGAFTTAGIAGAAAYDAATHEAHAADKPGIVAEQGGQLGHVLPKQASARAKAAVAKATAEPKPKPTDDQPEPPAPPRKDPPPPADEPAEDKPRNEPTPPIEAPPADKPPVEVPPVDVPVPTPPAETPLPPVEVPPLPSPPPVELPPAPRTDPLPAPPADVPPPAVVVPAAPAVVPGPLPAAVSPAPAAEPPPTGSVVDQLIAELTAGETVRPLCADDPDDARHIDRGALRALLAGLHDKPTDTVSESNPCRPQIPAADTTGAGQVKPPPPSAAELIVAVLVGSHVPPALGRLEHARPRAHLPTSRHVAIEPGPA